MKSLFYLLPFLLFFSSCRENPIKITEPPVVVPPPPKAQLVYVLNEGRITDAAGARLSLYNITTDSVQFNVIEGANSQLHLGSVGSDMKLVRGYLYILMSNSQNLIIVRERDRRLMQQFHFASTPQDIVIDSTLSKAYITQIEKNAVYVMNITGFMLTDSIAVGANPRGMFIDSSKFVYVCNSGYGTDSTVSIIDVASDTIVKTITVGRGPTNIVKLPNGNIAVACTGDSVTFGRIAIIDPASKTLIDSVNLTQYLFGEMSVSTDGMIYALGVTPGSHFGGPVHRINPDTKDITTNFIPGTFYSVTGDPATDDIYLTDVKQFTTDGEVDIFTKNGLLKKMFAAQKGPSTIVFIR